MQNNVNELLAEATRKLELGQHEEANRCYDRALELLPQNAGIWNNKGFCLSKLGQHDEAIRCYDRALELDPKDAGIWNNKGSCLSNLGQNRKAIQHYERALELDTHNVEIWLGYGDVLNKLDRFNEALRCFNKALKLNPKNDRALFNKGYLEDWLGNPRKAYKFFKRYIALNPSKETDRISLARQRVTERGRNTSSSREPQFLLRIINRRNSNLARLIQFIFGFLLAAFGYALTLLSPWLWLVAGPFILVTVILFRNAFLNLRFCPNCKKQIRVVTTFGKQVCPRCRKEFTLSSKK